ncbi:MAG: metal ABC transporter permease [bacterium]
MELVLVMFFTNISIIVGLVGTMIVLKKMTSIAGSISHSLLASLALANILKLNPLITSIPFVLITSTIIHYIKQNNKIDLETSLSIIWAFCVSIGIILLNLSKTTSSIVSFYLFGNILFVETIDLLTSLVYTILCLIFYLLFSKEIKNVMIDEEQSKIIGINTTVFNIAIIFMVSLAIVVTLKAVGIILLIALFTIPPTIAYQVTNSIENCILLSSFITFISLILGYYISFFLNLPISSTITITLILTLLSFNLINRKRGIIWKTN